MSQGAPAIAEEVPPDLVAAIEEHDLAQMSRDLNDELARQGVSFAEGAQSSPFVVDPVPRVIAPAEWGALSRALAQRVQALIAFVADVYGERAIVAAGVVPKRVVESADYLERDMEGVSISSATYVAGLDLVRGSDGELRVLEDNLRTPSGIAYAIAAREAVDRQLGIDAVPGRLDPRLTFTLLDEALHAAAPGGIDEPQLALLSDGASNSAGYEHRVLARELGIPIVLPRDLSIRGDRVCGRLDDGRMHELHVVYRRTDEDRLRHPDGRPTWLAEALLGPLEAGRVAVVNPFGAGVADDKLVHAYVEEMVRFYCGEEPLIESVRTYDLGDEDVLPEVLPRLDELVVKPRSGYGGEGVVVCPHASPDDRRAVRHAVEQDPSSFVAQEMVEISTHPTVCGGQLEPRHVDLRPFVVGSGGSAAIAPVALTRVALTRGALVVNSSQNGGGKDTWLLA